MKTQLIVTIVGAIIAGIFLLIATLLSKSPPTTSSSIIVKDNATFIEDVENLVINQ